MSRLVSRADTALFLRNYDVAAAVTGSPGIILLLRRQPAAHLRSAEQAVHAIRLTFATGSPEAAKNSAAGVLPVKGDIFEAVDDPDVPLFEKSGLRNPFLIVHRVEQGSSVLN